jgi:drug/metabolite transporter (DMT)-like permease
MAEPLAPHGTAHGGRRPLLGYAMVSAAATLFAVNGTVSKVVLRSGVSTVELTQARSAGAALGFAVTLALLAPGRLRVRARELGFLVLFGVVGVASVQWLYFVSIRRLPIGIALVIEYVAPLGVALFARFVLHEAVRRRIWLALALALTGLALVVEIWSDGLVLDGLGLAAAVAAAGAYAAYILLAERGVATRDAVSLTYYGFAFAALFWLVAAPPWRFPFRRVDDSVSLLGHLGDVRFPVWSLLVFVVVVGTMATFGLVVGALRHLPATKVGIVAMLEPVVASVVAWVWLGESLDGVQLAGGGIVVAAIVIAQTAR